MSVPGPDQLEDVLGDLASWQQDGRPVQLHPGDLGWHWRFGPVSVATALRVWASDGMTTAIGFLDGSSLVRMAVAPRADHDRELAQAVVRDLQDPARGVVDTRELVVEARFGTALRSLLRARGWVDGEPWTTLVRDLSAPVDDPALRVEVVDHQHLEDRVAVQRAAFEQSTFTADSWQEMARSPAYRRARCLVGYDDHDDAVATVTVWSAGAGRPGLLEPMGVHRDHRGRGHGTAICVAAAGVLRGLGASCALVATPSSNEGAVATYVAAGYRPMPPAHDFAHVG
jgi:GNAT superfamily N-acetyltransferase